MVAKIEISGKLPNSGEICLIVFPNFVFGTLHLVFLERELAWQTFNKTFIF
jgi:hypothetical protein